MNNLPTDKNQPVDNNQNVTNDNPTPVAPLETPTISNAETPPEKRPEEQSIEVGSLEQTPFTSYTQASVTDDPGAKKNKKIKTIASVLGILLIVAALPLSLILVKQRQEVRKEAAGGVTSSGSANVCGVTLSATHGYSNGRLTTTFTLKNTRSDNASFEFHTYSCVCLDRTVPYSQGGKCGTNSGKCTSTNDSYTLAPGETKTKTVGAVQPAGDCGSFQNDGFIIAVNGNQSCSNN